MTYQWSLGFPCLLHSVWRNCSRCLLMGNKPPVFTWGLSYSCSQMLGRVIVIWRLKGADQPSGLLMWLVVGVRCWLRAQLGAVPLKQLHMTSPCDDLGFKAWWPSSEKVQPKSDYSKVKVESLAFLLLYLTGVSGLHQGMNAKRCSFLGETGYHKSK